VQRALGRGADPVRGTTLIGDVFAKQGLWGEALERYRDVRRVAPDFLAAMMGEGTALLQLGRAVEARDVVERVLDRNPQDVESLMLAASARGEAGDHASALEALAVARGVAPNRGDVHKHIGDISRRLGDYEGAIAAYRSALALDGRYAVVRFALANVLMDLGQAEEAERELRESLEAVPTYAEATLTLARLQRSQGRHDEAMSLLIELLQRDPYHFDALITLGESLLDLGRKPDAAYAFGRVLRFDPEHPGALFYDGVLLADQHRQREAMDRWRQVVELQPASDFARLARRELKSATDQQRRSLSMGVVA